MSFGTPLNFERRRLARLQTLDAVDMIRSVSKLIVRMANAKMFLVSDIDRSIIAALFIRVNHGLSSRVAANYGLRSATRAARERSRYKRIHCG